MTALTSKGLDTHTARPGRPARFGGVFAAVVAAALIGYAGVAMAAGFTVESLEDEAVGKPEGRVALVIGNGGYEHVQQDSGAHNAAKGVGAALERLGFTVTMLFDAGYVDMAWGLQEFAQVARSARAAVVFYVGHGFAAGGRNFLATVDVRLETHEAAYNPDAARPFVVQENIGLIPLEWVMRSVEGALGIRELRVVDESRLRLVILDTDVQTPLVSTTEISTTETIVAQAARVGQHSQMQGPGDFSPYTEALLRYLEEPELELGMLFRKVRDDVMRATEGRQEPVVYGLPGRGVYLGSMPSQPPALDSDLQDPAEEQPAQ